MISVIVPVYNEEKILRDQYEYFRDLAEYAELIFVDGGSADATVAVLSEFPRVLTSPKGRARQMNAGAAVATQPVLLFHHADTKITLEALTDIESAVQDQGLSGGCLRQVIDQPGLLYRWIAWTGNVRAGLTQVFYGDQGIFVARDLFRRLGGFPEQGVGEDVLFSKRLRGAAPVRMLNVPIHCSPRRWQDQGVVRTTLINTRVKLGLMLGERQEQLSNAYRDIR